MKLHIRPTLLSASVAAILAAGPSARAQELPVPCSAGACGANGPATWVTEGSVTGSSSEGTFNILQSTDFATLNWASFNIGDGGRVQFVQPDESSIALNRIFQNDPSRIFGALEANGQVYLLNQNGFLFGENSTVNVATLIASSLDLTPEALENGILGAGRANEAAFEAFTDVNGDPVLTGSVTIEQGAFLGADGGRILIFAPEITNRGTIETPEGQTILAAGSRIFLAASDDDALRGLIVEVDGEGVVTNGDGTLDAGELVGRIAADRGNITLAGLAVNQLGRLSATTSVRQNGSIRLVARNDVAITGNAAGVDLQAQQGGTLTLGEGSITEVLLELDDPETTVDVNAQPRSRIELAGQTVTIEADALLSAKAGVVEVFAAEAQQVNPANFSDVADDSSILIEGGALIDVSGASANRSASDNIIEVELRGNQLADSPLQRDGALRSETVRVDIRQRGVRADGSAWQGTPLADASGEISNIERSVAERNLTGGTISLQSQGVVKVAENATLNISGGVVNYAGGDVSTTQVLGRDGQIYDIAEADRGREYVGIVDSFVVEHPRWGVTEVFPGFRSGDGGTFEPAYSEGYDAGTVSINAPNFVLDGNIDATTVVGRYQRRVAGEIPADSLYRAFDELPLGGELLLGNTIANQTLAQFVTGNIRFASELTLDYFNGRSSVDDYVSVLRPELFGSNGITRATMAANGVISLGEGVALNLGPGGRFDAAASQINFAGSIDAAGGDVALGARLTRALAPDGVRLDVAAGAEIDVSGVWVNDNRELSSGFDPLPIDGGNVTLTSASGPLVLAGGALIDVSGGAQRTVDGRIVAGDAGAIAISASSNPDDGAPVDITLDATLRAFALANGGQLSIAANGICVSEIDCAQDAGTLWLTPDLFAGSGFGSLDLTANLTGLLVVEGTDIQLQQQNFELPETTRFLGSERSLGDIAGIAVLPDLFRQPIDLSLNAFVTDLADFDFSAFSLEPGVRIGANSNIVLDPGAQFRVESNAIVAIDGRIRAPGGLVDVVANNDLQGNLIRPPGGVWVNAGAAIDVGGTSLVFVDDLGRRTGRVLNGGIIALTAERGGVVVATGSDLELSGATESLDILDGPLTNLSFTRQQIASNGGLLSLRGAEYVLIDANVNASAATELGGEGGTVAITIDGNLRGNQLPTDGVGNPLVSLNTRRIQVERNRRAIALPVGENVPDSIIGLARVSEEWLEAAAFANVFLSAESLFSTDLGGNFLAAVGEIRFDGGVDLALDGTLSLNAANIAGGAGDVALSAHYLSIGHVNPRAQNIGDAANARTGNFSAVADLIDVTGFSRISGFETVTLDSAGDIRLVGFQPQTAGGRGALTGSNRTVVGSLTTSADLSMTAQQVYPTTLTDFRLNVDRLDGRFSLAGRSGTASDVLSAGGRLTINASDITSTGVLRAPFGEIVLNADSVTLADGSVTSTSLNGQIVPFGSLQAGFDWTYSLAANQTLVFDGEVNTLPSPSVRISADNIDLAGGAEIDISSGGDLLASEFVTGIGGTDDYLSPEVTPGLFAILPGLNLPYAPIDPQIANEGETGLSAGDTVSLSGIGNLPAGTYTLLPARYALVPGAVLVRPVDGYTDILPEQQFVSTEGGVIIAGRSGNRAGRLDSRSSGFEILPQSQAFAEASYTLGAATEFFAETNFRTPSDAGAVVFAAGESLSLVGSLVADAGGRGASVDIAGASLSVVNQLNDAADGVVQLLAEDLVNLGAESILLGGERTAQTDGEAIEVIANTVTIGEGVTLSAPDIILVGEDSVTVEAGARVVAEDEADDAPPLLLSGDSALIRVRSGQQTDLVRTDAMGLTGELLIAEGATLSSTGAIALDATSDVTVDGDLDVDGGALRLGANEVTIGDSDADTGGLRLTADLLSGISASELFISANTAIAVVGDAQISVSDRLVLQTEGITAETGARLSLSAADIELSGKDSGNPISTDVVSGTELSASAERITLGDGQISLEGFGRVALSSGEALIATGEGRIETAGDLELQTPAIRVGSSGEYTIAASGALTATGGTGVRDNSATPGGLLRLEGDTVSLDTTVRAESGAVDIAADNGIELGGSALIDTSGTTRVFSDVSLATPGGQVRLSTIEGDVSLNEGSVIDVSAPGDANAGRIELLADAGSVMTAGALQASGAERSGDLTVRAETLPGFATLLNATEQGRFEGVIRFDQRNGDLTLSTTDSLRARQTSLVTGGDLRIDGDITLLGGDALFAAGTDFRLTGALVSEADTADSDSRIEILSQTGGLELASGSMIRLGSEDTLTLTLGRDALVSGALQVDGDIDGGRAVYVDGLATYGDSVITASDTVADSSNPLFGDAETFAASFDQIATDVGFANDERFILRPAIAIESTGDLTVDSEFNLFEWRFGDDTPGVLTLRAGGNLLFNESLNDGFTNASTHTLERTSESWSYKLIAGADLDAVDPLATDASSESGDIVLAPGTPGAGRRGATYTLIRTGTGNIDLAAARDVVFGNQASVIYTSGIATDGVALSSRGDLGNRTYPDLGGDITLSAGRDVIGAPSNQLFTSWLWRTGRELNATRQVATGWTVAFGSFEQNLAALGGGDVQVTAGRDVVDFSASIPSIGRQVGGTTPEESVVELAGGGDLLVSAGRDLLGGSYLVGLGDATIVAGGTIDAGTDFAPIFGVGTGSVDVQARKDLSIASVLNPTLLPQGTQQGSTSLTRSFFSTYADTTRIDLRSISGDVVTEDVTFDTDPITSTFTGLDAFVGFETAFTFAPPTVTMTSFGGDVNVRGPLSLFPSSDGDLQIFAENNITFGTDRRGIAIVQSDAPASLIGTVETPRGVSFDPIRLLLTLSGDPNFNSAIPVFRDVPGFNRVIARTGDVSMVTQSLQSQAVLYSPRPIQISAGRDIANLGLFIQHPDAAAVSTLEAGRDIIYPNARTNEGQLQGNSREIEVAGAGNLILIAGRDIDFQTAAGVTTSGDIENPALAETGASVSLLAGLNGNTPDYDAFIDAYLLESDLYDEALLAFVATFDGAPASSKDAALDTFRGFDRQTQLVLLERVLFDELRASGREAANPGDLNGDFTRGFDALVTLFPGANPDIESGEVNAFDGDIRLFFSRIYTLDGGDIQLIAPGGEVNAGLASPPTAFGIVKGPEDLGIVAQGVGDINSVSFGDFAVNESRVFAADGGNILVWSTRGDIDAGRGAKTAISAPPPQVTIDPTDGSLQIVFPAALTGSGIQTIATSEGTEPGDVDLFAPRGVVNAGDAGIVAGNLTVAAVAVLGADNIDVSGVSIGVPVDTAVAPGLANVSAVASGAQQAAQDVVEPTGGEDDSDTPLADAALGFLDVFIVSFGDCDPETGENCEAE